MDGERMSEVTTDSLYLTQIEVQTIINGLNLSMKDHYYTEESLPEDLIKLIDRFVGVRQNFKWCSKCRTQYYAWYSHTKCNCPDGEEE